jgi:hypothetical protein
MSEETSEFRRGRIQGSTDATLAEHAAHLDKINGSMERVATRLGELTLQMQRMADSMEADRATVLTTAKALRDADEARRDKDVQRWSPLARIIAVMGAVAGSAGAGAALWSLLHH